MRFIQKGEEKPQELHAYVSWKKTEVSSPHDALCQHSSGTLFYSPLETRAHKAIVITLLSFREGVWPFSAGLPPLQSHFPDPGGEEDSAGSERTDRQRDRRALSLTPSSFLWETLSYPTHPLITKPKLKPFPFQVKDGVKSKAFGGIQES